ncbi:MAG: hypothetical protein EOO83_01290, partial [Oxalobacteraceae bacterium]
MITTLTFVVLSIFLFGFAGIVKPFFFIKKRWHGGAIAFGSFLAFSVLNTIPLVRPAHIPEAEWAERTRVCSETSGMRECPINDTMVA